VADFERGTAREGRDIARPPSTLSNHGCDAYFFMPLVLGSSVKTLDDTRDERLALSELPYPPLNWPDRNELFK